MVAKQLLFRDEARDKIRRGVGALAGAVKVTPGSGGRTVILIRAKAQLADLGRAKRVEMAKDGITRNASDQPSVVLQQVDDSTGPAYGHNAATRTRGDLLQRGVMDLAEVTRRVLRSAGSIASLVLGTGCMIAKAHFPKPQQDMALPRMGMLEI